MRSKSCRREDLWTVRCLSVLSVPRHWHSDNLVSCSFNWVGALHYIFAEFCFAKPKEEQATDRIDKNIDELFLSDHDSSRIRSCLAETSE